MTIPVVPALRRSKVFLLVPIKLDRRGLATDNGGVGWQREASELGGGVVVTVRVAAVRRRSRQAAPRLRLVKFFLTYDELAELDEAAGQAGLARGAFAAEVTMAAARGRSARISAPLREALVELMSAAGLVRRVGTNLNQAAQFCVRVIRRLDEAAEHVQRNVP